MLNLAFMAPKVLYVLFCNAGRDWDVAEVFGRWVPYAKPGQVSAHVWFHSLTTAAIVDLRNGYTSVSVWFQLSQAEPQWRRPGRRPCSRGDGKRG